MVSHPSSLESARSVSRDRITSQRSTAIQLAAALIAIHFEAFGLGFLLRSPPIQGAGPAASASCSGFDAQSPASEELICYDVSDQLLLQ